MITGERRFSSVNCVQVEAIMGALFWLAAISGRRSSRTRPAISPEHAGRRPWRDLGILHVLKIGCRWQDCPPACGPSTTVYNRLNRWSRRQFWLKLLGVLAAPGAVTRSTAVASTYIKAQRSAWGKGGQSAGDRPRQTALSTGT
jgi:transposase